MDSFADNIYACLRRVPAGRVTTYRELARAAGCASAQAVGQALRRNPDAPRVPCHRVIRTGGWIGGFQGGSDGTRVSRKIQLLAGEGVEFSAKGRILEPGRILGAEGILSLPGPVRPQTKA